MILDDLESSKFKKINLEDFKQILEVLPIPIDLVDTDLNILYMNEAIKNRIGRNAIGEKCFEVYKDDHLQCEHCPMKKELKIGEEKTIETGGVFGGKIIRIKHKAVELRGKKYILEIFEDITESITDDLTGCFNRRKLNDDLKEELNRAKRYGKDLSLLMADIDWFKEYNDIHGHQKGDKLLIKLVRILSYNIRFNDKLYRYGGEEFVILLPETDEKQAKEVAGKLRRTVAENKFKGAEKSQPNLIVSISIGIASYPKSGTSSIEIINAADSALYEAKRSGKNIVKFYKKRRG
jgi:diguanylate cyclase (GGDEF)-like protein/PAS domain S-box-containing protein